MSTQAMNFDEQLMPGPCVICGLSNYPLSMGGPTICPQCDCGNFGQTRIENQRKEIERLRETDRLREVAFQAYADQEKKDRAEIAQLKQSWETAFNIGVSEQEQNKKLRAKIEQLTEHLATNDRILDRVHKELAKDSALVNDQRAEIERLNSHEEERYIEVANLQAENGRLQTTVNDQATTITNLHLQIYQLHKTLANQYLTFKAEIDRLLAMKPTEAAPS